MNVLLLSVGTRNKIVQYFKKEIKGKGLVVAADSCPLAPALYEADKYYIVPKIDEENYLGFIKRICIENNIRAVLSLIDPELNILAKHKNEFINIGVTPLVSDIETIDLCFNKYLFINKLIELGFNAIHSYIDKDVFFDAIDKGIIKYPVFIKPICGSASINNNKAYSKEEVDFLFSRYDNLMIQEFMVGKEFGVDLYVDSFSKKITAFFIKEKIKMRAGETDKSVSFHDEELLKLLSSLVNELNFRGVIDVDIFKVDGRYFISEINPRFGGGYPHAYECGVNIPKLILDNLENVSFEKIIYSYKDGIYMMKYSEIKIL